MPEPQKLTMERGDHYEIVDDCWIWQRYTDLNGYARNWRGIVSRQVYRAYCGPLEPDQDIHHVCQNTSCVNPAHLEAIDHRAHLIHHKLEERGLTLDDVREIRRMGADPNVRMVDVIERYGLYKMTVLDIWHGKSWPELGGPVRRYETCQATGCDELLMGHFAKQYCCPAHRQRMVVARAREREQRAV